jgi:hypothetical protein
MCAKMMTIGNPGDQTPRTPTDPKNLTKEKEALARYFKAYRSKYPNSEIDEAIAATRSFAIVQLRALGSDPPSLGQIAYMETLIREVIPPSNDEGAPTPREKGAER